jgi:drug/metabolite transporter (DMT)-like permease
MRVVLAVAMSPSAVAVAATLSVLSAFTYTFGLALQQKANLATPASPSSGARTAVRVVLHPWWLAGFGLGLVGFAMHGVALAAGSLTLVQVLQVSQIVFMVPLSAWVAHLALRRQDWLGGALVAVGLVGLLAAARPGDDTKAGTTASWTVAAIGAAVVVIALCLLARRSPWRAPILGAAAGVVFGVEAATLKVASDNLADGFSWGALLGVATWATIATAIVGVFIQNLALRAGSLASAQASLTISSPVVSGLLGAWIFAEDLDVNPATVVVAVACIGVAVVGVVLLSRSNALVAADVAPAVAAGTGTG